MKIKAFFADYNNRVAVLLAIGLLLFIAHYQNQPFLQYVFLPQIGTAILLTVVLFLIFNRWKRVKRRLGINLMTVGWPSMLFEKGMELKA